MNSILKLLFSLTILAMIGCAGDSSDADANADTNTLTTPGEGTTETTPPSSTPSITTTPATTPNTDAAASGETVFHYICEKGCEGSGSNTAGNCPVCGTALAHNQAFHNNPGQTPTITTTPEADPNAAANTQTIQTNTADAQNAAGVWHYTCPSGHAGGAGTATTCSECGATLVHNQAYHN